MQCCVSYLLCGSLVMLARASCVFRGVCWNFTLRGCWNDNLLFGRGGAPSACKIGA